MGLTGMELQPALEDDVGRHLMRGLPKPFRSIRRFWLRMPVDISTATSS
jgi:hypothetical protein